VRQEGIVAGLDLSDIQKGYKTKEIDHAIALRALQAMKDNGRAVLIIGGLNKLPPAGKPARTPTTARPKESFSKPSTTAIM
jgi:hypothetical protein